MQMIRTIEKDVEGLLYCDEIYWKQRSRVDWLGAGDRNSRYFHAKATARKKKNHISSLLDTAGRTQETEEGMAVVVSDFFASLFKSVNPPMEDIRKVSAPVRYRLSDDQTRSLGAVISADEIKVAVFSLNPTKAPGPDGFQAIFFQNFWGLVGNGVTRVCLRILNGEISIRHFNATNVVLIPKVNKHVDLRDFRLISLCNTIYKIVTKVIAARMKPCPPDIISPY
ncbi:hypothetical protein Dsin_012434 [Dipteronia sinensis]|uniref:Reverse transcriptase n=1 Tax=Dipteronia sinensis TaxID=43782 RepID=A0AAE0AJB7_9ROSI|nr:hypothetical protein Dsin_012434 [Dipteronia sinensis]